MKPLSEWIKERIKSIQEGMRHVEDQSLSRYQWYELAMKDVLAELKAREEAEKESNDLWKDEMRKGELKARKAKEQERPATGPHPDSDPHRLTGYRGNWPDMHPYSSAKPPVDYRDDSTAGRQDHE